jgi:allantoin racemase
VTLGEGPPGIETQAHIEQAEWPICRPVGAHENAAAFGVACFRDPGLHAVREATTRRVLGICRVRSRATFPRPAASRTP